LGGWFVGCFLVFFGGDEEREHYYWMSWQIFKLHKSKQKGNPKKLNENG